MALTTGLFVCALLATEIAGALYLARFVRARRKRHKTGLSTGHFPHLTPRKLS
jgi:hypothetical protein